MTAPARAATTVDGQGAAEAGWTGTSTAIEGMGASQDASTRLRANESAGFVPGICAECGSDFLYRLRGKPAVTCSGACRAERRRRQAAIRTLRWARRLVAADVDRTE